MVKKTITYEDFDGNTRTEDFFFNLTKAELTNMFASVDGGLQAKLQKIIQTQSIPELMETFRDILKRSYGEKSPDGRRFMKSDEIFENFEQTEAYSILFMELLSDTKKASDFIQGIIPKDLVDEAKKQNGGELVSLPTA